MSNITPSSEIRSKHIKIPMNVISNQDAMGNSDNDTFTCMLNFKKSK